MTIEDDAITEVNRARAAGKSYEQINAVALLSIAISQKRQADFMLALPPVIDAGTMADIMHDFKHG